MLQRMMVYISGELSHGKRKRRLRKEKAERKRNHFLDARALHVREIVKDALCTYICGHNSKLAILHFGKQEVTVKSFSFEIVTSP